MILYPLPANAPRKGLGCRVPCKLNLFLEVLGRRPDGYHDLETIMLAVDLCDALEIEEVVGDELTLGVILDGGQALTEEDPAWRIPSDRSNLVLKALERLRTQLGTSRGAHVRLRKKIPAQAGLGGGSADAAAALVLGSLLWASRLDTTLLGRIASELGSDINFFLEGWNGVNWTARCIGRGEHVTPIANPLRQWFVVVHPPQGCNTAEVFRALALSEQGSLYPVRTSCELAEGLLRGDNETVGRMLYNRLETAACECTDWIDRSARRFDRYKPLGHCLSGSGSARFCLCSTPQEAEKIANELRSFRDFRVITASTWFSPSIQDQASRLGFVS